MNHQDDIRLLVFVRPSKNQPASALEKRMHAFLKTGEGTESLDDKAFSTLHGTGQIADYLLWNRQFIAEMKAVNGYPAQRIERLIDDETRKEPRMFVFGGRPIRKLLQQANPQITDTRTKLALPGAAGLAIIMIDKPQKIEAGVAAYAVREALRAAKPRLDEIDFVWVSIETHTVRLPDGRTGFPELGIWRANRRPDIDRAMIGQMFDAWAAFNGTEMEHLDHTSSWETLTPIGDGLVGQILAAQVGGHDDQGVLEVDGAALTVGQAAVVQHLKQHVEDVGVGLLDFVEQDDLIGAAAHGLGQGAALVIADIARRGADQAADRVLLHVFAHVDAGDGVVVVEQIAGQRLGQLGLAHARRAQEEEAAQRLVGVVQTGAGAAHGGLALNLQLDQAAVDLVQRLGLGVDGHAHAAGGLVDQVDGLVGQEAVGDVAVRQGGGGDDGAVADPHAVVDLVLLLEAAQDRHRVLDGGFGDEDRLEATGQGRVLFDVLAVFIQRGGADTVQLAARQGGLEQVGGVHRAVALARPDQGVHLVDEEDDLALSGGDLVQHGLQPLLELAAVFGPGDQGAHVERQHLLVLQAFRHVAVDDPQCESFDDGGLADAGLADQDRVVLGAAGQHLDGAADLLVAADDGVDLAVARRLGQVAGIAFQGVEAVLGARAVGGLALADFGHGFVELLGRDPGGFQRLGGGPALLGDGGQQAFGGDEGVARLLGGLFGGAEDARQIARRRASGAMWRQGSAAGRSGGKVELFGLTARPAEGPAQPQIEGSQVQVLTGTVAEQGRVVDGVAAEGVEDVAGGELQRQGVVQLAPIAEVHHAAALALALRQQLIALPEAHQLDEVLGRGLPVQAEATAHHLALAVAPAGDARRIDLLTEGVDAGVVAQGRVQAAAGGQLDPQIAAGAQILGPGQKHAAAHVRRYVGKGLGGVAVVGRGLIEALAAPHLPHGLKAVGLLRGSAATAGAAGCAANSCRAGSGSRSADTAGGRSDRRGNSPETRARRWSRPRPRCRPVPAATRTGRTASRRTGVHRWRKGHEPSAPPRSGAGEADGLLRGQAVLGLIYRRLRRYAEDVGGQGVVLLIVAIIAQLVRPFVPGRIELVQHPAGDAPALHGEAARAIAGIGARQGARGVARLEHAAHIAVDVEAIGARLAGQHGSFSQPVFSGDAAEEAVLGRFNVLNRRRGAGGRAGGVQLFAQTPEAQALLVVTIAEIAGQGQLALLARAAGADIPASMIAHIGAQRSGRDSRARRPGGRSSGDRRRNRLGDQIDDPARAFWAVGGGRIGHHLDTGVAISRQLQHRIGAVRSRQYGRRAAIHQQRDIAVAAQGDVALRIDIDGGHIAQGLGQRPGRRLKIVGQTIADGVDRGPHIIGAGADDDIAHGGGLIVLIRLLRRSLNGTVLGRLRSRRRRLRQNPGCGQGQNHPQKGRELIFCHDGRPRTDVPQRPVSPISASRRITELHLFHPRGGSVAKPDFITAPRPHEESSDPDRLRLGAAARPARRRPRLGQGAARERNRDPGRRPGAAAGLPQAGAGQRHGGLYSARRLDLERHGAGLVSRGIKGRSGGPLGLRPPVRAPAVQGDEEHAVRDVRPSDRGRRRHEQRLHRRRRDRLLRGCSGQPPAAHPVRRGGPHGPLRSPVRPVRARDHLSGPPLSPSGHRLDRGAGRLDAGRRAALPRHLLPAGQRHADRGGQFRSGAVGRLGRRVFRPAEAAVDAHARQ
uniref:NDK domain-containing protein n=1 Tax=Parastrongyloides trichosuri TaxID=131310 RepID=A0A0N4ZZD3_PARTI